MTTVETGRTAPPPTPTARRSPARPLLAALWAGAAGVVALWWTDTGSVVGAAGWLTGAGRIAGLLCGYACAVLVALMARLPLLERRIGSDLVARRHVMAVRHTIILLLAHGLLILLGYAAPDRPRHLHRAVPRLT